MFCDGGFPAPRQANTRPNQAAPFTPSAHPPHPHPPLNDVPSNTPQVFFAPAGLYFCFQRLGDAHIFLLVFALFAIYFSGIMVR
jgi:hypothetical protein